MKTYDSMEILCNLVLYSNKVGTEPITSGGSVGPSYFEF